MRKKVFIIILVLTLSLGIAIKAKLDDGKTPATNSQQQLITDNKKPAAVKKQPSVGPSNLETNKYTIDNQSSIYYIVNKQRSLPSSFAPANLSSVGGKQMRPETAQALNNLISDARGSGYNFKVISGYRSYAYQTQVYNSYARKDGQAKADTYSARPGHSEHQTGLAVDLGTGTCDLQICFGNTAAAKWLARHAHESGFIVRYQKGTEKLTGYQYEPWHLRYVGNDLAKKIYDSGKTLEQFFGLPIALSY